jgi:hypothetical protein
LVDALDLGSSDESCGGSSPSARTNQYRSDLALSVSAIAASSARCAQDNRNVSGIILRNSKIPSRYSSYPRQLRD